MANRVQIDRFLSDPDFLALTGLEREQRLLFITNLSETRVSAFLGWLFRPQEGHGLGDQAVRELLLTVWRANDSEQLEFSLPSPRSILDSSFRDLLVRTEYALPGDTDGRKKSRSIDVLLVSRHNKLVIAIENKFGSIVHSSQLRDYRNRIEETFPNYRRVFVYLDSDDEAKPDDEMWIGLNYQWLIDLISTHQLSGLLSERALDALAQVKDYLIEDGAMPGGVDAKRDVLIDGISRRHGDVLEVFRGYRKGRWNEFFLDSSTDIHEPLLIEYHQRWWLWDDVLDQARHGSIVRAANIAFRERLEFRAGPAEVRFRLKAWEQFEAQPEEGQWVPSVTAWSGREAKGGYSVWSAVNFRGVRPDVEQALRQASLGLRNKAWKRPPAEAQGMRLNKQAGLSIDAASEAVVSELERLQAAMGDGI